VRGTRDPRSLIIPLCVVTAAAAHPRNAQVVTSPDHAGRMATPALSLKGPTGLVAVGAAWVVQHSGLGSNYRGLLISDFISGDSIRTCQEPGR
jgi:hypothetical protein